ncbi:MAG TPA: uroporphyrinogen-III C-methyltransferase [Burkholderiales bacterium]|nr:uroporphyrinogen-III C-methyltransferase [Burkholderiales bacterium]
MSEQTPPEQPDSPSAAPVPPRRTSGVAILALLVALGAAGVAAWQWHETRGVLADLETELAKRVTEIDAASRESRSLAADTRDSVREVQTRLGQLEVRVVETQQQRFALETLYQELSRSRDEWTLAEIEQIMLIANQQLQLAGNVKAALIALESADARLARSDRPQLTQLRRVLAQDIERLKAAPHADITGMGLRLENVINSIDELPLAMDGRPVPTAARFEEPPAGYWRALWQELLRDLRALIRVQNMQSFDPPLLAPEQAFFLRENLKLRLLSARLALLARDQATFRMDVAASMEWMKRYFDPGSARVIATLSALERLAASEIEIELPDINASLEAVRNYRLVRERTLR